MAEDKSDEWFAKHNRQKAAAWVAWKIVYDQFLNSPCDAESLYKATVV